VISLNDMTVHTNALLGEKYYEIRHGSGLRICVFPKNFSTCYGVIGTKFGSVDDKFKIGEKEIHLPQGTAHFLEHKLFESEDGISADERFAALGAETNAYTAYASTRYLFSATKNYGACIAELLRFVTHPYFTEENVEKERGIIEQEIMMYADDPYDKVMENCLRAMYRYNGIRNNICGSPASLKKITPDVLYGAYGTFYNLNNMTLSVCGDITPDEVIKIADRELPSVNESFSAVKIPSKPEGDGVWKNYAEKRMRVARPLFFIGIKDKTVAEGPERTRRSLAMTVLNNMLFSGTGEFYNRLLDERLITPGFSFGYSSGAAAMNYFSGNSDAPEKVYSEIIKKAEAAAEGDLDVSDFVRCKRSSLAAFFKSFDSSAEIADDVILSSVLSGVDPFSVREMIDSLTFEEIKSFAEELFGKKNNRTLSLVLPL